jgi:hypothetical protein
METVMARADTEIREFLETPVPPGAEDMRDLGVIGYANSLPGIRPSVLRELIATARRNGRSWDEIGRRLSMTAGEAEAAYGRLSDPREPGSWRQHVAAAIRAVQDALDSILERAAAEVEREHIRRW